MNRQEWEFEYTAARLAEGALAQKEHRLSRVQFWEGAKEKVLTEIRETGIEVTESMGDSKSYNSVGMGPQVMVRTDLQRKLTECHQKIIAHRTAAAEYDGWIQVLQANAESRLKLTQNDWLYFFGKV